MDSQAKGIFKKSLEIIPTVIAFLGMSVISAYVIFNDSKLYDDMRYADMITISESLSTQIYNAMMKSFSKAVPLSELASKDDFVIEDNKDVMIGIMSGTEISGLLIMPNGKVEDCYPKEKWMFTWDFLLIKIFQK